MDERRNELHAVFEMVSQIRDDVHNLRSDQIKLTERMTGVAEYMIRTQAVESERNWPVKYESLKNQVEELEKKQLASANYLRGQLRLLQIASSLVSFIALVLGIYSVIKAL